MGSSAPRDPHSISAGHLASWSPNRSCTLRSPASLGKKWLRITDQIRERNLRGEWRTGERIRPIRELAVEPGVDPDTVTKSCRNLQERKLVSNQRGRGYFVSENAAARTLNEMKEEFMRDELPRIIGAMRLLGIGMEEIAGPLSRSGNLEHKGDDTS